MQCNSNILNQPVSVLTAIFVISSSNPYRLAILPNQLNVSSLIVPSDATASKGNGAAEGEEESGSSK
jgi:hypothetical protein